jgi:serine/threonine-protein kinase
MKLCPLCAQQYTDSTRFCVRDGYSFEVASDASTEKIPPGRDTQADPLIGKTLAGRYRIVRKIGQGGMGAVYRGEHVKMNRPTAIKVLTSELSGNPEFVARFEREAAMAARISHPNAVSIYDYGEAEDGIVYLAMEFLEGEPLSAILKSEGALNLDRVLRITRQAADALHAAHKLGIIHRDFKPDNMIICRRDDHQDWVEVLDFGIAKETAVDAEKQALTKTGFVLGTPQYMSPEQVKGELLDPRSDLYSLAIVCYEMITGVLPFGGDSPQSQMIKRILEQPIPISQARPQLWLPSAVEQVVMRGLSILPAHRFSTTIEFASSLEQAARSQSYAHPQPPQPSGLWQPGPLPTQPPVVRPGTAPHAPPSPPPVAPPMSQPMSQPRPVSPQPFAPQMPPQPSVYAPQPHFPSQPYPYPPPQEKSRHGLIVIIIVVVFLALMGAFFLLAVVSNM